MALKLFRATTAFYLLAFLVHCSNAEPTFLPRGDTPGPAPPLGAVGWVVRVPEAQAQFVLTGVCEPYDQGLSYSWDGGNSWVVVDQNSAEATNVNCENKTFSIEIPNPHQNTTFEIRAFTSSGYTDSSQVELVMTF